MENTTASGAMAAEVRADTGATAARVSDAVRHAAHGDPAVGGMIRRLTPEPAADNGGYSATQNVSIGGNGNVGIVVGRDLHTGGRDPAGLARRAAGSGGGPGNTQAPAEAAPPDAILLVAADPQDLERLRLGAEERQIREVLTLSAGPGRWAVHTAPSVRLRDLTQALVNLRPSVVHFSGHGSAEGGVLLEDDAGWSREVPRNALTRLFAALQEMVECVVLNVCHSEPQARELSAHVPFVVGSPGAVADDAAREFSLGFYQAIGAGFPIPTAYEIGCVHMSAAGVADDELPKLIRRDRSHPLLSSS